MRSIALKDEYEAVILGDGGSDTDMVIAYRSGVVLAIVGLVAYDRSSKVFFFRSFKLAHCSLHSLFAFFLCNLSCTLSSTVLP